MKVLNILKYYYPSTGGTETYVKQLCGGMHKYGIEPSILTFNHIPRIKTAWGKVDDIAVRRVVCHLKLFSQPVGLLVAEMKQLIPKADLVHLHLPFPNAERLCKYISKPLVVTWCVDPVNTRWEKLFPVFRSSLIQVLEKARKIVLIGPNLLEHSPTLQTYEKKCKVIPLACSPVKGHEPVPTVRRFNGERLTVLFVGKLRKYKGVEHLIRSVQHLPDAQLRIVGDGEELSNLRQLTKELGINSRVIFLETVTDEQLSSEYKNANIFVLPSIDASEAFGIVQLEAMSYGLPVINTALPSSVPFVSLDGVTGITVLHSDPPALAAAIKRLCGDTDFYENCSRNAIGRAKLFSEENMIKKYSEVYRECV